MGDMASVPAIQARRAGPHGGFTDVTDFCTACHSVHEAAASSKLLPSETMLGICNTCHDLSYTGTGGLRSGGVYGAIRAQGVAVQGRHNIADYNETDTAPSDGSKSYEATANIPGGGSLAEKLNCDDCHTPHGNTTMQPIPAQRWRMSGGSTMTASNKILQDDVNGTPAGTYSIYGADWCAACHTRRHSDSKGLAGVNNHPVDQSGAKYFDPSMAAQGLAWTATATAEGGLPDRQAGWSREATSGWAPMCQQCHDNPRNVESRYIVTESPNDGRATGDNPRWQNFPHETYTPMFLVETGDDLCMNCHPTGGLP
jgi:predicted CXXCH cytochrome family protein